MLTRKKPVTSWEDRQDVQEARARVERLRADLETEGLAFAELQSKAAQLKADAVAAGVESILSGNEPAAAKVRQARKQAADALEEKQERIELLQATLTRAEAIQRDVDAKAQREYREAAQAAVEKKISAILDKAVVLHNELVDACESPEYQYGTPNVRTSAERLVYQMGSSIDALQTVR